MQQLHRQRRQTRLHNPGSQLQNKKKKRGLSSDEFGVL